MTEHQQPDRSSTEKPGRSGEATWGPWLLRGVFVATLVFTWWLVIYDHGVAPQH